MLKEIESDLKNVEQKLAQSLADHNFLLGAKASLESLYNRLTTEGKKIEDDVKKLIEPKSKSSK